MRTNILSFLMLLLAAQAMAQTDSVAQRSTKLRYFNNFLLGGLVGGSDGHKGTSFSFATTHGVRRNRLAVGLGTGIDVYGDWKVVPIFASASFDFARLKHDAFFVQMNGGYSISFYSKGNGEGAPDVSPHGGKMFNPMIGYRFKADRFGIYIAMGYKFQRNNYSYQYSHSGYYTDVFGPMIVPNTYRVQEDMQRFVVQMGFGWH